MNIDSVSYGSHPSLHGAAASANEKTKKSIKKKNQKMSEFD
jgi:hypothetical protein